MSLNVPLSRILPLTALTSTSSATQFSVTIFSARRSEIESAASQVKRFDTSAGDELMSNP
jgi:hypothetical protein